MNLNEAVERIGASRLVVILRRVPLNKALRVCEILVGTGVKAIEVTMDGTDALEIIEHIRSSFGDEILIGAGTVMSTSQLYQAFEAGVDVTFSPHLDEVLVTEAVKSHVLHIPGVATPTEVARAIQLGAKLLKLFPAGSLGASYLKDLLGPFSGTNFIATGGIGPANVKEFFDAGATAVGVGGSLVTRTDLEREDWDSVRERAKFLLNSTG